MRRALVAIAAVAVVFTGGTSGAPQQSATAFVLAGGGWGHGVGMSQWGAFGQAKAGRSYDQILAYYYRGTELGTTPRPVSSRLRVLVAAGLGSVTVSAPGPIVVVDGDGRRSRVRDSLTIGPNLGLKTSAGPRPTLLPGPVTLRPTGGSHLAVAGKAYRGELGVSKVGGKLQLVNLVGLEAYLLGVVPGEMPKDWPLEALKAQAVAARTYAIANLVEGKSFDLYSDWRSQVYYGIGAEAPGPSQAVKETRGQTLSFRGAPAETFYFSSSGGRTVSALDAFGQDVPYLVSVDDPWDELSPNHRWETQVLSGAQLARRLGLPGAVSDVTYEAGAPGAPAALRVSTTGGTAATRPLADIRTQLGLKSLDFRLGILRLDRPAPAPSRGSNGAIRLTGLVRDVEDVALERRSPIGAWVAAKRIVPAADGTFVVRVRVTETTVYRLTAGGLAGPALTLRIGT